MLANLFTRARRATVEPTIRSLIPEIPDTAVEALLTVKPYTMTSIERLWAMWQAVNHIADTKAPGDIVECGVWKGGNLALAGMICEARGLDRTIYGYDTYAGMSNPSDKDMLRSGQSVVERFEKLDRGDHNEWCYSPIDEVRANIARSTKYDRYRFVVGKCEETLRDPANLPERIAVLRLDTDWYESTKAELEQLYPRVIPGGIVIFDDYGHWGGARQAVDEYFAGTPVLLTRIDYTGRLLVKP
jgi:O-methyltransferase